MAIMYPDKPKQFDPNSQEDILFNAFMRLPDSYYVFHSFSIVNVVDGVVYESETDFVIFNPSKGLLCVEAKAGQVKYEEGIWKYGSGIPMSHDGPFNQAAGNKWKIINYIRNLGYGYLLDKCKIMHAVCFPSISSQHFRGVSLPSEADMQLMLTKDSLDNIEEAIERIFAINLPNQRETLLGNKEAEIFISRILAPEFNLVSMSEMKLDHRRQVFKTLLKEQVALLNYLEEQNTAVINGMAGTGKTVMAVEKARRHANLGEKVLFLCYNVFLKEHLQKEYPHENIDYYTIDGLSCKLCDIRIPDYGRLRDILEEMYLEGSFPYKHIIIDEGQDFGRAGLNEVEIVSLLKANAIDDENRNGSFYMFYDKNQMIQSEQIPDYISEADCKLTLYRNCRNTENIAMTSLRLLGSDKKPKLFDGAVIGDSPEMYLSDNVVKTVATLNDIINSCWANEYKDIQILTCKTESSSVISAECSTGVYLYKGKKIPFTTCRKYKGLEADAIIMVDMDKEMFETEGDQIMYVGSSRARYKLALIAQMNDEDCIELLNQKGIRKTRKPGKALSTAYNAKFKEIKE